MPGSCSDDDAAEDRDGAAAPATVTVRANCRDEECHEVVAVSKHSAALVAAVRSAAAASSCDMLVGTWYCRTVQEAVHGNRRLSSGSQKCGIGFY